MKRYFMVRDEDMPSPEEQYGSFHYIDLASHGPAGFKWNLMCLMDDFAQPHATWIAFPSLFDSKTTLLESAVPQECLADIGLTGDENTFEAVVRLGEINPLMGS
jgi:hypothetical protein